MGGSVAGPTDKEDFERHCREFCEGFLCSAEEKACSKEVEESQEVRSKKTPDVWEDSDR